MIQENLWNLVPDIHAAPITHETCERTRRRKPVHAFISPLTFGAFHPHRTPYAFYPFLPSRVIIQVFILLLLPCLPLAMAPELTEARSPNLPSLSLPIPLREVITPDTIEYSLGGTAGGQAIYTTYREVVTQLPFEGRACWLVRDTDQKTGSTDESIVDGLSLQTLRRNASYPTGILTLSFSENSVSGTRSGKKVSASLPDICLQDGPGWTLYLSALPLHPKFDQDIQVFDTVFLKVRPFRIRVLSTSTLIPRPNLFPSNIELTSGGALRTFVLELQSTDGKGDRVLYTVTQEPPHIILDAMYTLPASIGGVLMQQLIRQAPESASDPNIRTVVLTPFKVAIVQREPHPFTSDSRLYASRPGNGYDRTSLLSFNLSDIPLGIRITSASLRLYALEQLQFTTNDLCAAAMTENWCSKWATWKHRERGYKNGREQFVNWSPGAGLLEATPIVRTRVENKCPGLEDKFEVCSYNKWIELDVTPIASQWLDECKPNFGLCISQAPIEVPLSNPVGQSLDFVSPFNSDLPGLAPYLVIRFTQQNRGPGVIYASPGDSSSASDSLRDRIFTVNGAKRDDFFHAYAESEPAASRYLEVPSLNGRGIAGSVLFSATEELAQLNTSEVLFAFMDPGKVSLDRLDFQNGFDCGNASPGPQSNARIKYEDLSLLREYYGTFCTKYPSLLRKQAASAEFLVMLKATHARYYDHIVALQHTLFSASIDGLPFREQDYSLSRGELVCTIPDVVIEAFGQSVLKSQSSAGEISYFRSPGDNFFSPNATPIDKRAPYSHWLTLPGAFRIFRKTMSIDQAEECIRLTGVLHPRFVFIYRFAGLEPWVPHKVGDPDVVGRIEVLQVALVLPSAAEAAQADYFDLTEGSHEYLIGFRNAGDPTYDYGDGFDGQSTNTITIGTPVAKGGHVYYPLTRGGSHIVSGRVFYLRKDQAGMFTAIYDNAGRYTGETIFLPGHVSAGARWTAPDLASLSGVDFGYAGYASSPVDSFVVGTRRFGPCVAIRYRTAPSHKRVEEGCIVLSPRIGIIRWESCLSDWDDDYDYEGSGCSSEWYEYHIK